MTKTLAIFTSEGFTSTATLTEDENGEHVSFTADCDVDADGANGQNGERPAYTVRNDGSEHLANGGMAISGGVVVFAASWGKDIVIADGGRPKVFAGGVIASKTAYHWPQVPLDSPAAYVDSETIPYAVVQSDIINGTKGAVLGCRVVMTNVRNGKSVAGMVADVGPQKKIGEASIAACRALGLDSSPRSGGTESPIIRYDIYPGQHATINGVKVALQTSKGQHIAPA